eukprot:Rmarinus@m.987
MAEQPRQRKKGSVSSPGLGTNDGARGRIDHSGGASLASPNLLLFFGLVVVTLVVVFHFTDHAEASHHTEPSAQNYVSHKKLPRRMKLNFNDSDIVMGRLSEKISKRVAWNHSDPDFLSFLIEMKQPVVLTDVPSERLWQARKLPWTLDYISDRAAEDQTVFESTSNVFVYFKTNGKIGLMDQGGVIASEKRMPSKELFSRIVDPEDTKFLHYSQPISDLGETLQADVAPWSFAEFSEVLPDTRRPPKVNVWAGTVGAVTQMHYDEWHNLFFQLHGRKRFTLVPQRFWRELHLYPSYHPGDHMSQVDFYKKNKELYGDAYGLVNGIQKADVILRPGEVLYVPPFYFHHVQALEGSVGVSIFSDALDSQLKENMDYQPLPFDRTWDDQQLVFAVAVYIDWVVAIGLDSERDIMKSRPLEPATWHFIKDLVLSRHDPLTKKKSSARGVPDAPYCEDMLEDDIAYIRELISPNIARMQQLFLTFRDVSNKEIAVASHIEKVANWAVGSANVRDFFIDCFVSVPKQLDA